MRRELIAGTFSGGGDLQRATGAVAPFNNVNAYGAQLRKIAAGGPLRNEAARDIGLHQCSRGGGGS